jgi:hypothetical protein
VPRAFRSRWSSASSWAAEALELKASEHIHLPLQAAELLATRSPAAAERRNRPLWIFSRNHFAAGGAARLSGGAGAAIPSHNGPHSAWPFARDGGCARGPCRELAPRHTRSHAPITTDRSMAHRGGESRFPHPFLLPNLFAHDR